MAYIKNRSNYVKQTKHQLINGGSIWERDITTIGGLNGFGENQTPIYQSGNFILTVNTDNNVSRYFQKQKWEENNNGEVWTLNDVNVETNDGDTDDTLKIVLKPDYYSLKSFAYYGSCVELVRASVSNIANTFPGELFFESGITVHYETKEKNEFKDNFLGGQEYNLVDNPFDLDIHTTFIDVKEQESNPLKYIAANNNWEKYDFISGDSVYPISNITVITESGDCFSTGAKLATITISPKDSSNTTIYAYMNVGNEVTYLANSGTTSFSIRPKEKYLNQFYKSLDAFESILMNKDSDPKYTAVFEVTKENDYTLETTLKSFTFPTTYGGYNLAVNAVKYNHYINSLVEVADFYDEYYCDNLYRCMTHESIKNFDFSYTRSYEDGQTDAYIEGGEKFQNTLRLIAREFDEIKYYIDNIRNTTILTYDNIGNIPDYFLTDTLDVEGWDIVNVYPLSLTESFISGDTKYSRINDTDSGTTINESGETITISDIFSEVNESGNTVSYDSETYPLTRTFNQDLTLKVSPYSNKKFSEYPNGYFLMCCSGSAKPISGICKYDIMDFPYNVISADTTEQYKYEECTNEVRLRIKPYTSEREYTMNEVNNHFMKMLKLNSRYILRHKGTIKGIEMLLSLFGLKSKEYVDKLESGLCSGQTYDYEIEEKTTFMKPIIDEKDSERGDRYKIDWFNSTKSIAYSNDDYLSGVYNEYQGLPVAYDDIENDSGDTIARVLLPYFNKDAEIDGKPYYQMNGGWLNQSPYKFDKDNNIIPKDSYTETLDSIQSVKNLQELLNIKPQYLNNNSIVHVEDLSTDYIVVDGVTYPILSEIINGTAYRYIKLDVINKSVKLGKTIYRDEIWVSNPHIPLLQQQEGQYIPLYALSNNETIKVYLIEYNKTETVKNTYKFWDGEDDTYSVATEFGTWEYSFKKLTTTAQTKESGDADDSEYGNITIIHEPYIPYILFRTYENTYSTFAIFSGGSQVSYELISGTTKDEANKDVVYEKYESVDIKNPSHYFKLTNLNDKMELGGNGWNQLSIDSDDYRIANSIVNNFKGNNPHRGSLKYDNGYEYISYFTKLFKYAIENNKFDSRCYSGKDNYGSGMTAIEDIGFEIASGETGETTTIDDCTKYYKTYKDSKIHYFGNKYTKSQEKLKEIKAYRGLSPVILDSTGEDISKFSEAYSGKTYQVSESRFMESYSGKRKPDSACTIFDDVEYSGFTGESNISGNTFGYTEQIVNTKVVDITFYIDEGEDGYSSNNLIMTKYLDSVIVPYLTQMIPSNTIINIKKK